MNDKNKGLADNQEGEIILNESGTSITTDKVEGVDIPQEIKKDEEDNPCNEKPENNQEKSDML